MEEFVVPDASSIEMNDWGSEPGVRDSRHDMFQFQWGTTETGALSCPAASKSSTDSDVNSTQLTGMPSMLLSILNICDNRAILPWTRIH